MGPSVDGLENEVGEDGGDAIDQNVLRQYFSLSLDEAAKKLGVSRTKLKGICRAAGMKRWPKSENVGRDKGGKTLIGDLDLVAAITLSRLAKVPPQK